MSRNSPKNSDITIGIFRGKDTAYNKAILKALLTAYQLTTWEMAKIIQHELSPDESKEVFKKTQYRYSVIQRKNGRLSDLENKGYVEKSEKGKWDITYKGTAAILILEPELANKIHPDHFQISDEKSLTEPPPGKMIFEGSTVPQKVTAKQVLTFVKSQLTPSGVLRASRQVKKLIDELGIDLDRITNDKLEALVAKQDADDGFFNSFFKT